MIGFRGAAPGGLGKAVLSLLVIGSLLLPPAREANAQGANSPNWKSRTYEVTVGSAAGVVMVQDSLFGTTPRTGIIGINPTKPLIVQVEFDSSTSSTVAYSDADSFAVDMYAACAPSGTDPVGNDWNKVCTFTSAGLNTVGKYLINPLGCSNIGKGSLTLSANRGGNTFYFNPGYLTTSPLGLTAADTVAQGTLATAAVLKAIPARAQFSAPLNFCPNVFFRVNTNKDGDADATWAANIIGTLKITVVQ